MVVVPVEIKIDQSYFLLNEGKEEAGNRNIYERIAQKS